MPVINFPPSISNGPVASAACVCRCPECKNSFGTKEKLAAHFQESDPGGIDAVSVYITLSLVLMPFALKADKLILMCS